MIYTTYFKIDDDFPMKMEEANSKFKEKFIIHKNLDKKFISEIELKVVNFQLQPDYRILYAVELALK